MRRMSFKSQRTSRLHINGNGIIVVPLLMTFLSTVIMILESNFFSGLGGRSLITNLRCHVISIPSYFARSRRMQITKFTPFSTSIKEADSTAQISQTAYQIMQKIRELEALPFLHDCRSSNSKEQKWFNEYLDKKLTGEALSKKVNKLEVKNSRSPLETPRFSSAQVLDCTEKWIKEYIIGMNLCPYASGYANKRSVHIVQTFGLFAPTEYVKLHAQHLLAEKEVVVKLIIFPARVNYTAFTEMFDFMTRTEGLDNLIQSDLIKMDMFHPDALSPYFLDGEIDLPTPYLYLCSDCACLPSYFSKYWKRYISLSVTWILCVMCAVNFNKRNIRTFCVAQTIQGNIYGEAPLPLFS